jgi:hypothetical protein
MNLCPLIGRTGRQIDQLWPANVAVAIGTCVECLIAIGNREFACAFTAVRSRAVPDADEFGRQQNVEARLLAIEQSQGSRGAS